MREVHVVFDLMCDTSTSWHRQLLSGRRRFGGGVVSGTRAVDHQKNWCEAVPPVSGTVATET